MGVACFLLEDLPFQRLWLRRYADGPCPSSPGEYSYHHAMTLYHERAPAEKRRDPVHGWLTIHSLVGAPPDDDPRWPTKCSCGFAFTDAHVHQLHGRQISRRVDTGEEMILEETPSGAMWDAWWFHSDRREYKGPGSFVGPDGISLNVKLPNGSEWMVDAPANNGPGWTRSGTPPKVTASPSILVHDRPGRAGYHGWLRDGVLVAC